uniref:Uncharacterized protein n=1 Tax=Caenorhabditis japonica TaxID=281687 RepID=A0A8R1I0J1_CAEJA
MNQYWPDYNESTSDCRENYSYFGSADYLRTAYHFTALLTVPLSMFTFYCILRVTPKRMKNMKVPLIIAHAWSTNLDLMFTVYSGPMVFFPSASGVPLGFLGAVGIGVKWQSYWGQVSVTTYNNNAMLIMANHGLLTTCCTLLIYKPYRDFVKTIITGHSDEIRTSKTVETNLSGVGSVSTI